MVQVLSPRQFVIRFFNLPNQEQGALSRVYDYQSKRTKNDDWIPAKDLKAVRARSRMTKLVVRLVEKGFLQISCKHPVNGFRYKLPEGVVELVSLVCKE